MLPYIEWYMYSVYYTARRIRQISCLAAGRIDTAYKQTIT